MVLSCMDPRFQHLVHYYLKKKNYLANIVLLQLQVQQWVLHTINLKNGIKHFMKLINFNQITSNRKIDCN